MGTWDVKVICRSISWDTTTHQQRLKNREALPTLLKKLDCVHPDIVRCIAYSPDGSRIATGSGGISDRYKHHKEELDDLEIQLESREAKADQLGFYPSLTNSILNTNFHNHTRPLREKLNTQRGVISDYHSVWEWDVRSGKLIQRMYAHMSFVTSLAYSPDGSRLASGSKDGSILEWEVNRPQMVHLPVRELLGFKKINTISYSSNGKTLAAAQVEAVYLWNMINGQVIQILKGHTQDVICLEFSPDNGRLASGGKDGTIVIWHVKNTLRGVQWKAQYRFLSVQADVVLQWDKKNYINRLEQTQQENNEKPKKRRKRRPEKPVEVNTPRKLSDRILFIPKNKMQDKNCLIM